MDYKILTDLEKSEHKNTSYNYKGAVPKIERLSDQRQTRYFAELLNQNDRETVIEG